MKTTITAALKAAKALAFSDYRVNLGVERRAVSKDIGKVTNISIWCYTLNARYKGCYKCGSVDNLTGDYTPGYDIDMTDALKAAEPFEAAEPTAAPATATTEPAEPTLAGTEKQIAYASDIRVKAIAVLSWVAANPTGPALDNIEKWNNSIAQLINRINSEKSATHIIETFNIVDFSKEKQTDLFVSILGAMNGRLSPKYF